MVRDGRPNLEESGDDSGPEAQPLRATVDAVFRREQLVTDSIKENLRPRTVASDAIAERARKAFKDFSPSAYSAEERGRPTYLAATDDLGETLDAVSKESARALQKADRNRGIRLTRTPALDELIRPNRGARRDDRKDRAPRSRRVRHGASRDGARRPSPPRASRRPRRADVEGEAEKRLSDIEGGPAAQPAADRRGGARA